MSGLQDPRADQRGGERERQVLGRRPRPWTSAGIEESVSVSGRVSELQTDERRALVHARERGHQEHRQRRALPLRLRDPRARRASRRPATAARNMGGPAEQASGFTVNGQRPNSNNMTIDGVDQHRHRRQRRQHGHHQHRRRGRVQDPHQRLPGGVRPGGRAARCRSSPRAAPRPSTAPATGTAGAPDWNANSWTNKRAGRRRRSGRARSSSCRTRRATTTATRSAVRSSSRARSTRTRRSSSSSGARSSSGAQDPVGERQSRVPTAARAARATSRRASTTAGTRSPTSATTRRACPAVPANTARLLPDGGVLGKIPPEPPLPAGPHRPQHLSRSPNFAGDERHQLQQPGAATTGRGARTCCAWTSRPPTSGAFTGRYMNKKDEQEQAYGTTWAGAGSNNLDAMDTVFSEPRLELHGLDHRHPEPDHVARGERRPGPQLARLRHHERGAPARGRGPHRHAAPLPGRRAGGLHPRLPLQRRPRRAGTRASTRPTAGPFTNENTTWDVLANLTQDLGRRTPPSSASTSRAATSPRASSRASTARSTSSTTPTTRSTRASPTPTRRPASSTLIPRPPSTRCPSGATRTSSGTLQDNWKTTRRLTLDYGVRFYYLTPQWDTTLQASNFLPDEFDSSARGQALRARVHRRLLRARARTGAGWIRPSRTGVRRRSGTPWTRASSAASSPARTASTAPSRPARASTTQLQDGSAFRISPRFGFAYDVTRQRRDRSSAAAPASSTTARRATWCST